VTPGILTRLEALGIRLLTETKAHAIFVRANCMAVVTRHEDGVLDVGSSGLITERGLAFLVLREQRPLLASHGTEVPAEPEQVEAIRRFSTDLKAALGDRAI
jgi:hypothetical protein